MRHSRITLGLISSVLLGCSSGAQSEPPATDATGGIDEGDGSTRGGDGVPDDDAGLTTEPPPGTESSTGEMNCGEQSFVLDAVAPNVMLILDRSGSMADNFWDGDAAPATPDVSRWSSLFNVVDSVVTAFNNDINFGAQYFPSDSAMDVYGAGACLVDASPEVPVAPMNADAVLASLAPADIEDLEGATPASAGVLSAVTHLQSLDDSVDRFIILVTDGAANCGADSDLSTCPAAGCELMELYDEQLPELVQGAFDDDGIPTFVVAIDVDPEAGVTGVGDDGQPQADTYVRLNDVAVAGGRALEDPGDCVDSMDAAIDCPRFYNAVNELELQSALEQIAGQVFSCTLPLSAEPLAPEFVEVDVGGMSWPNVQDCGGEDGWVYTNPEGPYDAIELCGAACEALAGQRALDITFGCPPQG